MGEPSNAVFISYRRDVGGILAMALHQHLTEHGLDAFYDIVSIRAGQFDTIILSQIAARPYFVLVLTPGTLERCVDPTDWLRREIEQALKTQRMIVPVHTPNFDFGEFTRFLPNDLGEEVKRFQAQELPQKWFNQAVEQLVEEFLVPTEIEAAAPSAEEQKIVDRLHEAARAAPAVTEDQLNAQEYFERAYARPDDDQEGKIADYSEAVRLNREYAVAFNNRAIARRQIGDLEGARADDDEATRLKAQAAEGAEREREEREEAERLQQEAAERQEREQRLKRKRERRRLFLILGGVAVALVSVVAVVVLIRGSSDGPTTTLLFEDDFSSQERGWRDVAEEQDGGSYVDGAYLIDAEKIDPQESSRVGVIVSPADAPTAENVRIDVEAVVTRGTAVTNGEGYAYGIVCRAADDFDDLYRFTYWPKEPGAHIQKRLDRVWLPLADEPLDQPAPGVGEATELRAQCVTTPEGAAELDFFVNDEVIHATDPDPLETAAVGLNALLGPAAAPGATLEVQFDNFAVSEVEAEGR